MRKTTCVLVATLICGLVAPAAHCDVLHLANGNTVRGRVVSEQDGAVQVEMPFGLMELSREEVNKIERDDIGYVVQEGGHAGTAKKGPAGAKPPSVQTPPATSADTPVELPPEKIAELDNLVGALKSKDRKAVDKAYDGLVASGKEAVPYLNQALAKAGPRETPHLMLALYEIDRTKAFGAVATKASDKNAAVRQSVAVLLGEMRDRRATPVLVECLSDKKYYVRRDAAKALAKVGDSAAIRALVRASGDNDAEVRAAAANALRTITKKSFTSHKEWNQWWSRQSAS